MKKTFKIITCFVAVFCFLILGMIGYSCSVLDNEYTVTTLDNLHISSEVPIEFHTVNNNDSAVNNETYNKCSYEVSFDLFGIFPVGKANVTVTSRKYIDLIGKPFGVKLYTDGVLIVNLTEFESVNGDKVSPGKECGLEIGDYIISVNGEKVYSNDDVEKTIAKTNGNSITVVYSRDSKNYTTVVTPVLSSKDGLYHLGIWLRDSSAGIGTLTFYDSENKTVGGLGHALCDTDTGEMISVNRGSIVSAEILSITKSADGQIGELMGRFKNFEYSNILMNSNSGIYARCEYNFESFGRYPVATKFEISEGKAQILTTIDGEKPILYDCEISKIISKDSEQRNFIVTVTDVNLISETGGIVQGMSGSPIIQNGKFVGAVTHVIVNNPKKGYAIFAENMIKTDEQAKEETLKAAS